MNCESHGGRDHPNDCDVCAREERDLLRADLARAQAEAASLRAALESVSQLRCVCGELACPWCGHVGGSLHRPSCARGVALSSTAGSDLLAYVEALEELTNRARAILGPFTQRDSVVIPEAVQLRAQLPIVEQAKQKCGR